MKISALFPVLTLAAITAMAAPENDKVTLKSLSDRAERGKIADRRQMVRGDSGKWNDKAILQRAPSLEHKPNNMSLDDWADQLAASPTISSDGEETWLIYRTRQLDDNDRVWIESIERRGDTFTIVMCEAIWRGYYNKTFTYYEVLAINLGRIPSGKYEVQWVAKPLAFERFEDPGKPKDNWPKDEEPAEEAPVEVKSTITVR